jgi:hypothetical protein
MKVKEGEGLLCEGEKIWKTTSRVSCAAGKVVEAEVKADRLSAIQSLSPSGSPSLRKLNELPKERASTTSSTLQNALRPPRLWDAFVCLAFRFRLHGA